MTEVQGNVLAERAQAECECEHGTLLVLEVKAGRTSDETTLARR